MNRSILIVICDFLLVSLLAFSTVDINKAAEESTPRTVKVDIETNQVAESGKDLAAVMRLALDEERRNRDQLMGELAKAREAANRQQMSLSEREQQFQKVQQELQNREQQLQSAQTQMQSYQAQVQKQEQEGARLAQARAALEQQYATAQTNIQILSQQLKSTATESMLSKERLAAMEAQLSSLQKSNELVLAEKQRLSSQLQVAEVERKNAAEQVVVMKEQVKVEREEKARLTQQAQQLAEGVKVLANKSGELAQEVRENRPLAPNLIYSEFLTNRVQARLQASRELTFGNDVKRKDADSVLVSNGTNVFAVCHVTDTPFNLLTPATEWDFLSGTLTRLQGTVQVRSLCFYNRDPRLVFVPLTQADVQQLGAKPYKTSADPFKWQDAVLVGTRDAYYGECRFQLDPSTPEYVRLDNSFLKGLFGKFNPSRGDLVFSKTGELLGVMANSDYCLIIKDFTPAAAFKFGDVRSQKTGIVLSHLYSTVASMPPKLQ